MSTVKMQTYHYILSGFVKPNIFLKSVWSNVTVIQIPLVYKRIRVKK
jgi:hypothetical protein